jgi:hypothetical protein
MAVAEQLLDRAENGGAGPRARRTQGQRQSFQFRYVERNRFPQNGQEHDRETNQSDSLCLSSFVSRAGHEFLPMTLVHSNTIFVFPSWRWTDSTSLMLSKNTVDFTSVSQRSTTVPSSNTTPSTTLPMPLTPLASSVRSRWNSFIPVLCGRCGYGAVIGSTGYSAALYVSELVQKSELVVRQTDAALGERSRLAAGGRRSSASA